MIWFELEEILVEEIQVLAKWAQCKYMTTFLVNFAKFIAEGKKVEYSFQNAKQEAEEVVGHKLAVNYNIFEVNVDWDLGGRGRFDTWGKTEMAGAKNSFPVSPQNGLASQKDNRSVDNEHLNSTVVPRRESFVEYDLEDIELAHECGFGQKPLSSKPAKPPRPPTRPTSIVGQPQSPPLTQSPPNDPMSKPRPRHSDSKVLTSKKMTEPQIKDWLKSQIIGRKRTSLQLYSKSHSNSLASNTPLRPGTLKDHSSVCIRKKNLVGHLNNSEIKIRRDSELVQINYILT